MHSGRQYRCCGSSAGMCFGGNTQMYWIGVQSWILCRPIPRPPTASPRARARWCCVDARPNVVQNLGDVLNLVEDNRQAQLVQEGARIRAHARDDLRILEQPVRGRGWKCRRSVVLPARPGPVRPREDDGREAPRRSPHLSLQRQGDVGHLRIPICRFRKLKPRGDRVIRTARRSSPGRPVAGGSARRRA